MTIAKKFETAHCFGFAVHPDRQSLIDEAHARPARPIPSPAALSRIAMWTGDGIPADRAHLLKLCSRFGLAPPPEHARHYTIEQSDWSLVWERHTEITTYTFHAAGDGRPFAAYAISFAPADWIDAIPGLAVAAAHVSIIPGPTGDDGEAVGREVFGNADFVMTEIGGGSAALLSEFRMYKDGFTRMLVIDRGDNPNHRGRLVLQLLEIETYRLAALLALPVARTAVREIEGFESQIAELTERIVAAPHINRDRDLLIRLSRIAAEVEALGLRTAFRFTAAEAYFRIVRERIARLDERGVDKGRRLSDFMERRLEPAMKTVEAVDRRRRDLAAHVSRANQLLLARIDVAVEEQHQLQLRALERRARHQLRLQETVEVFRLSRSPIMGPASCLKWRRGLPAPASR